MLDALVEGAVEGEPEPLPEGAGEGALDGDAESVVPARRSLFESVGELHPKAQTSDNAQTIDGFRDTRRSLFLFARMGTPPTARLAPPLQASLMRFGVDQMPSEGIVIHHRRAGIGEMETT